MGGEVEYGYEGDAHEEGPGKPGRVHGGGGEGLNASEEHAGNYTNYVVEHDSLHGIDVVLGVELEHCRHQHVEQDSKYEVEQGVCLCGAYMAFFSSMRVLMSPMILSMSWSLRPS